MLPSRPALALFVFLGALPASCSHAAPPPPVPAPPPRERFAVDAVALRRNDPVSARVIAESPLAYFRLSNQAFADAVCARWASAVATTPAVASHGDAHVEQYAATPDGRGLTELDVVASGPPFVDLARFATSLVLAMPSDPSGGHAAVLAFLHGYERALDDPQAAVPEPAVVARLRARVGSTLDSVSVAETDVRPAWAFADVTARLAAARSDPSLDPAFFTPKPGGGQTTSGSPGGHVVRILARVEGPSPAPEDDLVVEARGFEPAALGSCMRLMDVGTVAAFHAETAKGTPERFLGADVIGTMPFFFHAWAPQRTLLRSDDVRSAGELSEVAEDAGAELGRVHGRAADGATHRAALKRALEPFRGELPEAAAELAGQLTRAWRGYLKESNQVAWRRGIRRPLPAPVDAGAAPDAGP